MTTISVTADDIAQGVRKSICGCPVARATRRALGLQDSMVCVFGAIYIRGVPVEPPLAVDRWIQAFDDGGKVSPFTFDLEVPKAQ